MDEIWSVYVLECQDGTFYTGVSPDPAKRYEAHCAGKGAAYTRSHPPRALKYVEKIGSRGDALRREYQIKSLTRLEKEKLISGAKRAGRGSRRGP